MSNHLISLIEKNEWAEIPLKITTREGHTVDTSDDQWHLPYSMRAHSTLDFSKIINSSLRWATKRYIQEKIQITSTHAGYSNFQDIKREFLRFQNDYGLVENLNKTEAENKLISIVEDRISQARAKHRLWALYRPIQWYIWCAENYPELGFCSAYAMELDSMILPGNPKGEAVRMEDSDSGPLHRSLELPLLIKAMREDKSLELEHLQQKVAVALSIAHCKDYVWVKDDKGRVDDLKRQYSMTVIARETAEKQSNENNPKRSIDWLAHNDKKLNTLTKQLADNNITEFDPYQYLEELTHE